MSRSRRLSITSKVTSGGGPTLFREWMRKPELQLSWPVLVPSRSGKAAQMGTALDYAIRAGFAALWPGQCVSRPWVASATPARLALAGMHEDAKRCQRTLAQAQTALADLDPEAGLTEKQALACWDLALMEPVGRGVPRVLPERWTGKRPSPAWISELQELLSHFPWDAFVPQERCLLNPDFGEGSQLAGGADADLVLDGLLIDIKTVSRRTLAIQDVRQVVSYALLARAYGFNGGPPEPIERVGIYYSRSAELVTWSLEGCVSAEGEARLLEYLVAASEKRVRRDRGCPSAE